MEGLPQTLKSGLANLLGEIVGMDRSIGRPRRGLKEMNLADNTLVWFCSDNGGRPAHDPDANGDLRGEKGNRYEGGIRVPGLVVWPGKIQPQVTDFPASTLDIMPTIIDLVELPKDSLLEPYDGESIVPLFAGKTPQRNHSIPFTNKGMALIDGNFKRFQESRGKNAKWGLYGLEANPKETVDVARQHLERVERMKEDAEALMDSVEASAAGKDYPEGRVIQPQRGDQWSDSEEYQELYDLFAKLKPDREPPGQKKREKGGGLTLGSRGPTCLGA